MKTTIFATNLLSVFFEELNKSEIDYLVLRNYEGLPETNSSKDVDFLIADEDHLKAHNLLIRLSKKLGYNVIWVNKLDYLFGYAMFKSADKHVETIKIDLFSGLKWRGLNFMDEKIIFENKLKYKILYIPSKSHEAFVMILYYILYAKQIRQKYHSNIVELSKDHPGFGLISEQTLNHQLRDQMLEFIDNGQIDMLVSLRGQIVKEIVGRNLKLVLTSLKQLFQHLYCEVLKRNSFGVILIVNDEAMRNDLSLLFGELGISEQKEVQLKSLSLLQVFRKLRRNNIMVSENRQVSRLQSILFRSKILDARQFNLKQIAEHMEKNLGKEL
ncbi:MAG: hypothetical protein COB24_07430 [Hyphomicrobiales bacterium]|nr:MAG: hypothetical protein COB24_07430 [Hyphomicrobiales bacterium]